MKRTLAEKLEAGRIRSGRFASDASFGPYGLFRIMGPCGAELLIMASAGDETVRWEHVSVSIKRRPPNWQEMCFAKALFWEPAEAVMQLHPPEADYVNNHAYCLHLWRPIGQAIPLPPASLVGVQSLGVLHD